MAASRHLELRDHHVYHHNWQAPLLRPKKHSGGNPAEDLGPKMEFSREFQLNGEGPLLEAGSGGPQQKIPRQSGPHAPMGHSERRKDSIDLQ